MQAALQAVAGRPRVAATAAEARARPAGTAGDSAGRGASTGSAGAYSRQPHPEASMAASAGAAGASWFTGGDLLALVLVAGTLALVTAATVRLSGMGARHE